MSKCANLGCRREGSLCRVCIGRHVATLQTQCQEYKRQAEDNAIKARAFDAADFELNRRNRAAAELVDEMLRATHNLNLSAGMSNKDLDRWVKYRSKTSPAKIRAVKTALTGGKSS